MGAARARGRTISGHYGFQLTELSSVIEMRTRPIEILKPGAALAEAISCANSRELMRLQRNLASGR